ncbi:MAG: SDR family NAD(P)-dependent oxidoreductase, partial [Acidobacteria bacterium]|nr:SDR family NAD(P)-dependent oxidoreductase [Acidobacteriota bacterium]
MELGLRDKVCVVTGSTAGIGLDVARQLQAEGARVVTTGRSADGIGEVHVAADITKRETPDEIVRAATAAFGRIDCLV